MRARPATTTGTAAEDGHNGGGGAGGGCGGFDNQDGYEIPWQQPARRTRTDTAGRGRLVTTARQQQPQRVRGTVGASIMAVLLLWTAMLLVMHHGLPTSTSGNFPTTSLLASSIGLVSSTDVGSPLRIRFDHSREASTSASSTSGWARQVHLPTGALVLPHLNGFNHERNDSVSSWNMNRTESRSGRRRPKSTTAVAADGMSYAEDVIVTYTRRGKSIPAACRPPSWSFLHFPTCNGIHEINLAAGPLSDFHRDEDDAYLVASGFYRDVWVVIMGGNEDSKSVLKTTRYPFDVDLTSLMNAKRDALVMERLTSSPNIVQAWGHCGTSTWVEALPHEVEPYVVPKHDSGNYKFTSAEKLHMAIEMAESLAELHGYSLGSISHGDVQLSQWLQQSRSHQLKLGDFHTSRILNWNQQRQVYCPYSTGTVFGNYRSPEEYSSSLLNEQVDVYSYGNNLYCLLTGRWVFHSTQDDQVVRVKVRDGERPMLPDLPRTLAERRLVELMNRCWETDPNERITIFDAVKFLRKAVAESGLSNSTSGL